MRRTLPLTTETNLRVCFTDSLRLWNWWGLQRMVDEVLTGGVLMCHSCMKRVSDGTKELPPEKVREFHSGLPSFNFREHANATLPAATVKAIREDRVSSHADLADAYGVDEATVRLIRRGKRRRVEGVRH